MSDAFETDLRRLAARAQGLCECGCGGHAPIAKVTQRSLGHVKGEPVRFISGHNARFRSRSGPMPVPPEERFWRHVDRGDPSSCWPWAGAKDAGGYGRFYVRPGSVAAAHRFAFEMLVGPIPAGLQLDHLCRNRACVNPAHLEPVTQTENVRRGVSPAAQQRKQTHCKNGHPLSGDNLYKTPRGRRECRTCQLARTAKARAARKAAEG